MNPLGVLPNEALQAILIYSWLGVVVFGVLGVWEVDKARKAAAKAKQPVRLPLKSMFIKLRCPAGHCAVVADRPWVCPVCGIQMASDAPPDILLTGEAAGPRFVEAAR